MSAAEDSDDLAEAAIEEYFQLLDAGQEIDQAAFIDKQSPGVADALRSFFGSMSLLQQFGVRGDPANETSIGSLTQPQRSLPSSDSDDDSRTDHLPWTSLLASFGRYRVEKLLGRGAMGRCIALMTSNWIGRSRLNCHIFRHGLLQKPVTGCCKKLARRRSSATRISATFMTSARFKVFRSLRWN